MTLRVAYLTGEYPRATDTFIQREVAALRAHGLDIHTCSIRRTGVEHHVGEEQRTEAANTFHVLAAAKHPLRLISAHFQSLTRSPARYFRTLSLALRTSPGGLKATAYQLIYFAEAAVLARHLHAIRAQHLHNHIAKSSGTVAMLAAELAGLPHSFTLHGPDIFFEPRHWRLDEKIRRARFVACISEFCRAQAMAFSHPEDWPKLHIVHCGVDPARYTPQPRQRGAEMLFVGRLSAVKGLPVLFDAMPGVKAENLHLTIVGDGPDRTTLEAQATGLPVTFLGYRSQSEVAELLAKTDLLVLPSFAEGVPVVLMEAMAAELPVVTTQVAGIPELVQNGISGLLVPPGAPDALANAISDIVQHPDKATKMGKAGRAIVCAEFDSNAEAARLAHLFRAYHAGETPAKRPEPAP
ncbi:glycosyltransferase family 4 protein [Aquicoccus sp. G2-2]|uniref:glycosyltransferase family 4 protein n=1 Tax=Aquicoccus sp. G2-2 TaxID=3092120 RepID=UPI002ADF7EE0|nr:glycosyltransferase family 4 protein [Aquicoccus sp. G2-2]MEA1112593.1 glycosyltransferase family 4 protein [Aquicoccus sp. G2-2]